MYRVDDIGSTYLSLPPSLQNIENECFSYAFDRQVKKLYELAQKLTIWSDIDRADPKYYDYMAVSIRTPYYKSEYSDRQKLELIKSALEMRKYAGTLRAVEELLDHSILNARFVPWYEYGGEPYHFKVETSDEPGKEARALFGSMLKRVKAARSIIDGVVIDHDPIRQKLYFNAGIHVMGIISIPNKEKIERRVYNSCSVVCAVVINKQINIEREKEV